jgi:tRNA(fMet)-specific endonuclease VapC
MYLLDTNTLIYFFKGQGRVSSRLLATPPDQIGVSAVVLYELETGIAKSASPQKRRVQLERLANTAVLVPFGKAEALASALIRASLEHAGTPIGPMDVLIAGSAVANQAILVTRNTDEFSRVANLALDNWF